MSTAATDPVSIVNALWDAVYDRDWARIASFFIADSIYYDVPVGAAAAARGPDGIVARLRLGIEPLSSYEHVRGQIACTGDVVMVEHAETWRWASGESVLLPFVTVHRVVDGKVLVWKDYWDYRTLLDAAPPGWTESLQAGDLSWVFDATGLA
jgi:limonene-1,2-epoxide hydrolase